MQEGKEETPFFTARYIDINKGRMLMMKAFLFTVFLFPSNMNSRKMGHRINKRVLTLNFEYSHYLTVHEFPTESKLVGVSLLATDIFRPKTEMLTKLMSGILQFVKRLYHVRSNDALERLY